MHHFVTGATGFLGSALVDRLIADGHDVTALTRDAANAAHLPDATTVVEGDVAEAESMRAAMTGVDGVFHLAGWYHVGPGERGRNAAERVNVEGTRAVLELVDELAIPKAVYTSTNGIYGTTDGVLVDETYRPPKPGISVYNETKWRAHFEVAEPMIEAGLPLVILQPGAIFGPGDRPEGPVRQAIGNWLKGRVKLSPKRFALPVVYVDDAVDALLAGMDRGDPGETYIVAADVLSARELFAVAAAITGRPPPRAVSPGVFRVLATLLAPIHLVWPLPAGFEPETLRTFGRTQLVVDNTKGVEELGLTYRDFDAALYDYLVWEYEQRGLDPTTLEAPATSPMPE